MSELLRKWVYAAAVATCVYSAQAAFVRTETAITTGVTRVTLVDESVPQRVWLVKAAMSTPLLRFDYHLSQNRSYDTNTTVPAQAAQIADAGVRTPIAGINGDFFGYSKSATQRLAVFGGRYIQTGYDAGVDSWTSSSDGVNDWSGCRFYESPDGAFHLGKVNFSGTVSLGGTTYTIQRMNAVRDAPASGVAVFTAEYRESMPAAGILVDFAEPFAADGNAAVANKAFTVVGTIASGSKLDVSMPQRAAIIGFGTSAAAVSAATGDGSVSLGFKIGSADVAVRNLVGVFLTILNNGSIVSSSDQNETKDYPRTCLGFNPDTDLLVLLAADGRQADWSTRISSAEVAQILIDEGCTYGVQFDGGGSTTIWDCKDGLLNSPSDGSARPVATALFLTMDPPSAPIAPVGEPLPYLYPTNTLDNTTFGDADTNFTVPLGGVDTTLGAYIRTTFDGCSEYAFRLQGAFGVIGGVKKDGGWDSVFTGATPFAHERYFYISPGSDSVNLAFQSMCTVTNYRAEVATEADAAAWSDEVWSDVNANAATNDILSVVFDDYPMPNNPLADLPRFKSALTNGTPFSIHFLGDSISQDTYASMFTAKLRTTYPESDFRFTIYAEGSTGCAVYQNKLATAIPYTPDLLVICGLDNFRPGGVGYESIANASNGLVNVIRYAKTLGCEILYMSPAHSADSRGLTDVNALWNPFTLPWGTSQTSAAFNPADNDVWTQGCYNPTVRNAILESEDVPCWDIYPQSYDFVSRSGRPWGWFNRDALHNNERGRALIAHLLMAYVDKGAAYVDEPSGPVIPEGRSDVLYVGPDGTGTGTSWGDLAPIGAINSADGTKEVWLKAGDYTLDAALSSSVALTIRGGFAGTESDATDRVAGAKSVLDGDKASGHTTIFSFSAASGTIVLDGLILSNAYSRAVYKSGKASAVAVDCVFTRCGLRTDAITGRGGYWSGGTSSTLAFSNCVFRSNYNLANSHNSDTRGAAAYITNFKKVTIDGCTIEDCGLAWSVRNGSSVMPGRDNTEGYVLYCLNAPLEMTRTRVAGNTAGYNGTHGGAIFIDSGCGGTRFANCAFVGNHGAYFSDGGQGGVLRFCVGCSASVESCTFAYNVFPKAFGAAIVLAGSGTVTVSNSIFWDNVTTLRGSTSVGSDVYLVANTGTVTLSHSLVGGTEAPYLYYPSGAGGRITTSNLLTATDPLFATSSAAFTVSLTGSLNTPPYNATDVWFKSQADALGFDVHLQSYEGRYENGAWQTDTLNSQAIDMGNPSSAYALEPAPNGGRLNLGAYGNTPEASKTKLIVAAFAGEVTVDAAHDYTRPHFSVSLAENAEAYVATVEIAYSTSQPSDFGAETLAADWRDNWGAVDIASSAAGPGDSVEAHTKGYYATGTTIWWRLAVTTSGGTIWREGSVLLSGSTPPAWGRGGDASVIHVWTEASGIGDGSTWLDGCTDMESAFALVTETRTNIWIAGTVPAAKGVNNPQMLRAVTIIGGFTGMENAVADRPLPIARAVISGHNQQYKGCLFSVPEGAWTTLCDVDVTGAFDHGIQKTGDGSLALYNVDVYENACNSLLFNGRGLHLVGNSSKSELVLSNVVVKSNYILGNGDAGNDMYTGSGLYLTDFKLTTMTDVSFVHNGIILSKHDYCPGRDSTDGGSIYVKNARVLAKNVAFVGNNSGCNTGRGCVMYLTGNCNGSVFENCRWVGNEHCHYSNGTALLAGALTIGQDQAGRTVELKNCTFAFNTGDWATCAGLHVNQGKVTVRNSIFAKNVVAKNVGLAADLRVSGGTLDIDYSLLTANTADYITQDTSKITMGEHMLWGDPAFATDDATFLSYVQNGAIPKATSDAVYFKNSDGADMRALDVHLRSKAGRWTGTAWTNDAVSSVCIDAAAPGTTYASEPTPNGFAANLGCYGNTAEASKTKMPPEGTICVKPDGDPEANGALWGLATTLSHALDLVVTAGGGEIWMKGGTYPVSAAMSKTLGSCAVSIRGGFAGGECSPDERVPGTARAKLDAQGGNLSSILSLTTSAGLTLENVSFLNAQPASGTGTAVTLTGGSGCDLVVSNCTFEGNLLQSNPGAQGLMRGLKINTFRSAVIDDSLFVSNGYAQAITSANNHYGKDSGTKGAGLWIAGTPFTMRRCRIAANKFTCHCDNASAFWVSGNCTGSIVKNCAFVGNLGVRSDRDDGKGYTYESAAVVDMDTLARTIVFDNCTFAYNSQIEQSSPAGLSINKATVTVKNSIFYANTQCGTGSSKVAADIYSSTPGISVSVDYCWFAGSDTKFVFAGAIMGSHNIFASEKYPTPSFASALTDYADAVNFTVSSVPRSTATWPNIKSFANAAALDVHLRSKGGRWSGSEWINDAEVSVCIDKGDPATAYEAEPEVNGGQVNLGAYGGTAEASKSIVAEAAMSVTDTTGNDYTQPNAAVTCPEDPNDGIYHLQIWFCYGETAGATNDLSSWSQKVLVTSDAQPGSSFVARPMRYFESGTTLKWCVIMTDAEGNAKLGSTVYTSELTGETPPWYGKGGGAMVLHVRPGATGKGDGSTWTDAVTDWATAFGMFTNGSPYAEMWLSGTIETTTGMTVDGAPVTRTYTQPLAIRGGFTGSENTASDRPADGTIGTIDGLGTAGALFLVQSDYTVELDRIAFNGCVRQAVVKTGAGDLIVKGCRFYRNIGPFEQYGRALTVTGSSGSTVVAITNSIFGGNYYTGTIGCARGADGGGLWAKDLKALIVDHTLFASNGLARSSRGNYASQSRGYAVYIENAPTVMAGVDFVQNVGSAHITDNSSGESAVLLTGSSSGSRFENCSWVGNMTMDSDTLGGKGRSNHAGAMSVYLATKNDTVAFTNCTFAYNFILDYASPGGLNITRGRASIGNSIFYGNATCKNGSSQQVAPADLAVSSADGYAAVDYTFFVDGTDAKYVTQTKGRIAIGEHCLSGSDPAFATDVADVMALIQPSDISAPPCIVGTTSYVSFKDAVDAQAFDVHLKSSLGRYRDGAWLTTDTVDSPCLDKGDATWEVDSDAAREPKPNAGRVNLGRYGNTSEASKSEPNNPALGDVTLDLECDYTMPHVSVELAGTGTYGAKVWFCYGDAASAGEGTNGWAHVVLAGSGFRGDTIDASPRRYFEPNTTFTWCVVMMSADGTIVYGASEPVTSTVGADVAPWYGKGGGAGVLHVRAGATGLGTGENWSDALSSLDEAYALIDDSHNEIWLSGDHATSASPVAALTFAVPVTLRGGFAARENTASERVTGAKSNFDGAGRSRVFWIGGTNAFTVDGFNFRNGRSSLFEKDGAGDLTILNCRFADLSTTEDYITAVRLCGTGASRLAIDGVTVENIRRTCGANTGAARGMVVTTFASATIKDSLFARCGYARSVTVGAYSHSGNQSGSALCVIDTPVTITGSTFYGNSYPGHVTNSGSYDGNRLCAVLIAGACGNSVMRNCFVGANSGLNADSADGKGAAVYSGTMVVSISSGSTFLAENCTFAYNQSIESHSPLALNLYEGVSTVRNCIFYGNVKPGGVGADIGGKSSSTVEYSFFKDTTSAFVSGVTLGAGNITGEEPYFVTTLDDFKATLATTCSTLPTVGAGGYFKAAIDTEPMFNVHLRGNNGYLCETNGVVTVMPMPPESGLKQSPCIDAGDPATSVKGKEANPNAGRVNLGRWGNTAWASRSASTGLVIMLF